MVDGQTMAEILSNSELKETIKELLLSAESVILYRSSPLQKAELVSLMKTIVGNKKTCSIGDGANDVNMIQRAHVGIGIMGKEGNQAAQFSDFAVPEFQHLRRLMFWHGSQFGYRLTVFSNQILFKNMVFTAGVFFQACFNGFSGDQ